MWIYWIEIQDGVFDKFKSYRMQANVEAVRVAGLVTTLVSMAGDNRRMDGLPNSVGPRVCICMCVVNVVDHWSRVKNWILKHVHKHTIFQIDLISFFERVFLNNYILIHCFDWSTNFTICLSFNNATLYFHLSTLSLIIILYIQNFSLLFHSFSILHLLFCQIFLQNFNSTDSRWHVGQSLPFF